MGQIEDINLKLQELEAEIQNGNKILYWNIFEEKGVEIYYYLVSIKVSQAFNWNLYS